jgi:hypothetical protein
LFEYTVVFCMSVRNVCDVSRVIAASAGVRGGPQ